MDDDGSTGEAVVIDDGGTGEALPVDDDGSTGKALAIEGSRGESNDCDDTPISASSYFHGLRINLADKPTCFSHGKQKLFVGAVHLVQEKIKEWGISLLGQVGICDKEILVNNKRIAGLTTNYPRDESRWIKVVGEDFIMSWTRGITDGAADAAETMLQSVVELWAMGPWGRPTLAQRDNPEAQQGLRRVAWIVKQPPYTMWWENVNPLGWLILQFGCEPGFRPPLQSKRK